jgi:hypothetical protein
MLVMRRGRVEDIVAAPDVRPAARPYTRAPQQLSGLLPAESSETINPPAARCPGAVASAAGGALSGAGGELKAALNDDTDRTETQAIIRALVVLTPRTDGVMDALLYGELAGMLELSGAAAFTSKHPGLDGAGCQLSVVAGAGCHLCRTAVRWI